MKNALIVILINVIGHSFVIGLKNHSVWLITLYATIYLTYIIKKRK
jgi:hypothetical protein